MYSIRKVYLDHVGYKDAWYQDVEIPLYDNSSSAQGAASTIISLTNGGGKTTLLSLIFSCFIPDKRQFVQHLQKPNHHFEDYFGHTPGLILLELVSESTPDEMPIDPLVIGQYVTISPTTGEDDRIYFLFTPSKSLSFEDVPSLGNKKVDHQNGIKRWLQSAQTLESSFFYSRNNQTDWRTKLEEYRELDIWTIGKQIDFCRSEGGIDHYINFRSEQEFLEEFFYMTLPESEALSVRKVLAESLSKLKKRPENEKRRRLLTRLKSKLEPFVEDAAHVNQLDQHLGDAKKYTASLYHQLSNLDLDNKDALAQAEHRQKSLKLEEKNISTRIDHQKKEIEKLHTLQFSLECKDLEQKLNKSKGEINELKANEKALDAATVLIEKRKVLHATSTLQKNIEDAGAGLGPLQNNKNGSAAIYYSLLEQDKEKKQAQNQSTKSELEALREKLRTLEQQRNEKNKENAALSAKSGQLDALIQQRDKGLTRLVEKAFLARDQTVFESKENIELEISTIVESLENCKKEQIRLENALKSGDEEITAASIKIGALRSDQQNTQKSIEKGQNQLRLLQNNPLLFQMRGTRAVDADSAHLAMELDRFLRRKEDEISEFRIQQKNTQYRIEFVEDTGSLLMDEDTRKLIYQLKEKGIDTLQFYPDYLAEQFQNDVKKIQETILKNPSLYLGIIVFGEDAFQRLESLDFENFELSRPISISVCPTDEHPLSEETIPPSSLSQMVVGPSDLSIFDQKQVECKLEALKKHGEGVAVKIVEHEKLIRQVQSVKTELDRYNCEFGNGLLELQINQLQATSDELQEVTDRVDTLKNHKQSLLSSLTAEQKQFDIIKNQIQDKEKVRYELVTFIREHEDPYRERKEQKRQLETQISEIDEQLEKNKVEVLVTQKKMEEINHLILTLENSISEGIRKLSEIDLPEHLSVPVNIEEDLTLEMAKEDFQTATTALTAAMNKSGLVELRVKLEGEQKKLKEISHKYAVLSEGIHEEKIEHYADQNEMELASINASLRSTLDKELMTQGNLKGDLKQLKKEEKEFKASCAFPLHLSPLTEMSLEEIVEQRKSHQTQLEARLNEEESILSQLKNLFSEIQDLKNKCEQISDFKDRLSPYASIERQDLDTMDPLPKDIMEIRQSVNQAERKMTQIQDEQKKAGQRAENSFYKIKEIVQDEDFRTFEGRIASEIINNPFEAECRFANEHLTRVGERIEILTHEIEKTQQDLDICIQNLLNHSNRAIHILKRTMKSATIPSNVTNIGGRHILKMKGKLFRVTNEQKKLYLENYIKELADSQMIPNVGHETGDQLTASLVNAIAKSVNRLGTLGIEILKLSTSLEYSPIHQITGSGGESMTAAMLLYQVIAQLRADMLTDRKNPTGGFLLLDNPFAKVTTPQLIEPQVELAKELGYQLIYATAIKDFNAQAYFPHVVQLRKTTVDKNSGKTFVDREVQQIESSEYTVYDSI